MVDLDEKGWDRIMKSLAEKKLRKMLKSKLVYVGSRK